MYDALAAAVVIPTILIGLPWLVFHYITRWKTAATLTTGDEAMLEELHDLARRLDDRVNTVERILTADNPGWRAIACDPASTGIEDRTDNHESIRRIK
jgi:phage shock protein B